MNQPIPEETLEAWLHEATIDMLGLWQVYGFVRDDWVGATSEEIKHRVLALVGELLSRGVYAFNPGDGKPWTNESPDSVIERISREWSALGREPDVPDIVWFKR